MGSTSEAFQEAGLELLALMLHECFSRSELERLVKKAGLEYPGYRLSAIDSMELAFALAEGVIEGEPWAQAAQNEFTKAIQPIQDVVAGHDASALKKMVDGPWAFGTSYRPGALATVLGMDPRKEVRRLARRVLQEASPKQSPPEAPRRVPAAVKAWAGSLARRLEELESHVEELKRKMVEQGTRLSEARAENEPLRERLARAEAQALRAEEGFRLQRAAEKESQSLRHEIAELRRQIESLRPLSAELETSEKTLREREAEITRLRSELETASRRRPEPQATPRTGGGRIEAPVLPSRDPSRAGLVVDAQSLYFASRRRGGRLDYVRMRQALPAGLSLGRSLLFFGEVPGVDTKPFRERMSELGYEIHAVPAPPREQGRDRPDERALRALAGSIRDAANRYGAVVVATQCASLAPAMAEARASGARVRLLAFVEDLGPDLRAAADEVIPLAPGFLIPLRTGPQRVQRPANQGAGGA